MATVKATVDTTAARITADQVSKELARHPEKRDAMNELVASGRVTHQINLGGFVIVCAHPDVIEWLRR